MFEVFAAISAILAIILFIWMMLTAGISILVTAVITLFIICILGTVLTA